MNGVEAMKYGRASLSNNGTKKAPQPKPGRRMHQYVAFRLLTIELADSNALAVLVDVTEVADADGLGNVGAGGHSELHGLLDVVAILYHLCRNAARVQSPAQTEETSLMLNSRLAYQISSPLEK